MASSFSGPLHRPLSAMAVAAFAAVSSIELPDKFSHSHNKLAAHPTTANNNAAHHDALPATSSSSNFRSMPQSMNSIKVPFASLPIINTVHRYTNFFANTTSSSASSSGQGDLLTFPSSASDVLYRWHLPHPRANSPRNSQTVVVLLGWLGSRQKHLNKYADWYTSRGYHVVTFTLPMSDIVTYNLGRKADNNVQMLSQHLADWVTDETDKTIIFHTFSNTGWLCYGVILDSLQRQDPSALDKIKACVVDSAPVAAPDPQVWASGFSAALLKKHSVATKGTMGSNDALLVVEDPKPPATEALLLSALGKFFHVVLNHPAINRRLCDVMEVLSSKQPKCPQLYMYSSADRVIPARSVESFIEGQRRAGHQVRACNFVTSPHVDHYRTNPELYANELSRFLFLLEAEESSSSSSSLS